MSFLGCPPDPSLEVLTSCGFNANPHKAGMAGTAEFVWLLFVSGKGPPPKKMEHGRHKPGSAVFPETAQTGIVLFHLPLNINQPKEDPSKLAESMFEPRQVD